MKLAKTAGTVLVITVLASGADVTYAAGTGRAAIEVSGINPVTAADTQETYFEGKTLRPFMETLPSIKRPGLPEAGQHDRMLLIVSRDYNIGMQCIDATYNVQQKKWIEFDPLCAIAVRKNYEPGNPGTGDLFPWEPKTRLTDPVISKIDFAPHTNVFRTIEFYGKEAGKFLSILPPGGKLRITGAIARDKADNRSIEIFCGNGTYTRADGVKESGVVCRIDQNFF